MGGPRRSKAMNSQQPSARGLAAEALEAVLGKQRPLGEALEGHSYFAELEGRDRAFARNLASTTLRRLGQIDAMAENFLNRPLPQRASLTRQHLRLGICQLLFFQTPPHAAVNNAVANVRAIGQETFSGLVNAVLRKVDREGADLLARQDAPRLNTPHWMWESWNKAYGPKTCRAIAKAHLIEAPLDITVRKQPQDWVQKLEAHLLPTGALRRPSGGLIADLPGYAQGAWWVQDAAAALPVRLFGNLEGKSVADLCAAPGGKTAQLAASGARVLAVERSPERVKRLEENLQRLGLPATVIIADALSWRPSTPVDAVLLDVPCSATGTLRRHPDVARIRRKADISDLTKTQDALLDAAFGMLCSGGQLVYCTCSLQPEEGPDRIAAFLARNKKAEKIPVETEELFGLNELISAEGDLRTLPSHSAFEGGMDGFFAARLRRI